MPAIGRNEPCPCGSGKKYKSCHGPIDAEQAAAVRRIKAAPDTLLPKLLAALDRFGLELPDALQRFWNGSYDVHDVKELDRHEDRGSERFLTWFAFDSIDERGLTPVQRLAAEPDGLDLTPAEQQVLASWGAVRLQPYMVVEILKGFGLRVRPLFGEQSLDLEDHKAAKRVEVGEVLITQLIPAAGSHFIAGTAAQLTPDTVDQLREFAEIHLEDLRRSQPAAQMDDLIRTRSYVFNHFVMALPREEQEAGKLDELVAMTRSTLNVTVEQLGLGGRTPEEDDRSLPLPSDDDQLAAEDQAEVDADSDANVVAIVADTTQTLESGGAGRAETPAPPPGTTGPYDGLDD